MTMAKSRLYTTMIHSREWQALRAYKIQQQPLCEGCLREGRSRVAEEVHHIKPVDATADEREQERRMFDYDNLMSLCRDCHFAIHKGMAHRRRAEVAARRKERIQQDIKKLFPDNQQNAD